MSSFVPRAIPPTLAEPDPTKHVNYTFGMVLGVDDFKQEFAYLAGRDRWLARDLIGYGTATGLRVGIEVENGAPQIVVSPGVAVSPRGQLIRVAPTQCADLNLWLAARHEELRQRLGSVAGNRALLSLYLVLSYRDCATDMVPIPGEPCRSQDETVTPSRFADDFKLELLYDAPRQTEEDALRDFVEWLGQIEVTDEPGSFSTLEELEKAIRDATRAPAGSPPAAADFFYGSPPAALRIHPSMSYEYLRAVFRLWTTELRPRWHEARGERREVLPGAAAASEADSVLLAEVSVPLARATANTIWQVESGKSVEIEEGRRPYLVHLRMLQELVVSGRRAGGGATSGGASIGPAFGVVAETTHGLQPNAGKRFDYARADHTHGTPPAPVLAGDVTGPVGSTTVTSIRNREILQTAPAEGQVLTFTGGKWQPATPAAGGGGGSTLKPAVTVNNETSFGQTANVGSSVDYARADHTHGTPAAPVLAGDVTGATGATKVTAIQNVAVDPTKPTTNGQLLGFDQPNNRWKPVSPPSSNLAGDVTGSTGASTVVALRSTPVDATKPTAGQFLGFDAPTNSWKPLTPPAGSAANFVGRPAGLTAYGVAAAGVLKGLVGDGVGSYNNLRVTKASDGVVTMLFDGYQQPPATNPTQQYIVKALAVLPSGSALNALSVVFGGFNDNATGFTLLVNNAGTRVPLATLNTLSFMVEVSQYDVPAAPKAKEAKESKEKDTKESKEKDTKESKEKDTKESKEKDTKESKEKDTKESKEKDTKESKEKDTKESKEKDTKEGKDTKDTKEQSKDTKEAKEEKENKDRTKEAMSLKEKDRDEIAAPNSPDAPFALSGLEASAADADPDGRAFIVSDERPQVGRAAIDLADKQDDKLPEGNTPGKQAEAFN